MTQFIITVPGQAGELTVNEDELPSQVRRFCLAGGSVTVRLKHPDNEQAI